MFQCVLPGIIGQLHLYPDPELKMSHRELWPLLTLRDTKSTADEGKRQVRKNMYTQRIASFRRFSNRTHSEKLAHLVSDTVLNVEAYESFRCEEIFLIFHSS